MQNYAEEEVPRKILRYDSHYLDHHVEMNLPGIGRIALNIKNLLGQGAYAKVFQGLYLDAGKVVACKVAKVTCFSGVWGNLCDKSEGCVSCNEIRINEFLGPLDVKHEFIPRLITYAYVSMPKLCNKYSFLTGRVLIFEKVGISISQFFAKKRGDPPYFKEDAQLFLGRQLVRAIDFCLKNKIATYDVKPQNILINEPTMHLYLIDFGIISFHFSPLLKLNS